MQYQIPSKSNVSHFFMTFIVYRAFTCFIILCHARFRLMNTTAWTISIQNMSCDARKATGVPPWIKHVYLRISKDAGDVVSEIFPRYIWICIPVDINKTLIQTMETPCTHTDEPWIKNKDANHPILEPKY